MKNLQFRMSEMNTARPRIPSPFETAGIFVRPCAPVDSRAPRKKTCSESLADFASSDQCCCVVERQREPRCVSDGQEAGELRLRTNTFQASPTSKQGCVPYLSRAVTTASLFRWIKERNRIEQNRIEHRVTSQCTQDKMGLNALKKVGASLFVSLKYSNWQI